MHPSVHVCELICSLLRTPTAQISGVPHGLLRNVIAPHGRADALHSDDCTTALTRQCFGALPQRACPCMDLHTRVSSSTCGESQDGIPCAANAAFGTGTENALNLHDIEKNTCRGNIGLSGDVRSSLNQHCTKCMLVYVRHDPRHRFSYWPVRKIDLSRGVFPNLRNTDSIRFICVGGRDGS